MIDKNEIPKNWKRLKLGDVCKVRNGYAFKSNEFLDSGILLFRQTNLDGEKVRLRNAVYLPNEYLEKFSEFKITKGDVLIGMSGSIGKLCVYNLDSPALQNQRTGFLIFSDLVERKFIRYYFEILEKEFKEKSKGVAVLNISAKDIQDSFFALPLIEEQKAIVSKIEELLSDLENGKQQLLIAQQQLKVYRQSVLEDAFKGTLTYEWRISKKGSLIPPEKLLLKIRNEKVKISKEKDFNYRPLDEIKSDEYSTMQKLPNSWCWIKPEDISAPEKYAIGIGPFGSNLKVSDYKTEGIPLIFVKNITRNDFTKDLKFISTDKFKELMAHSVKPLDIVITKMGDPPGDCTIYPENRPPAVLTSDCLKRLRYSATLTIKIRRNRIA